MEREFLRRRTTLDRVTDLVADFAGSFPFVLLHLIWFAFWVLANFGFVPHISRFDPYPYPLLSTIVSGEAVLLATFVLMKQNRMGRRADEREHLHLQINLLAEQEITKILQTLKTLCDHMGVRGPSADPVIQELTQTTAVHDLANELREKIHDVSEQRI